MPQSQPKQTPDFVAIPMETYIAGDSISSTYSMNFISVPFISKQTNDPKGLKNYPKHPQTIGVQKA